MSWQPAESAQCNECDSATVDLVISPRERDLGGFSVRRVLPVAKRRKVGPFVFFDAMGPADFPPGEGIDVRPHPHIGLATLTYLFEGEILHHDSLGFKQPIRPGAVNWMTAGRGIVHSERTSREVRDAHSRLYGIQAWIALPAVSEEIEPAFEHYPEGSLPVIEDVEGCRMTLIAGAAYGAASPVKVHSPLFYLEVHMDAGASLTLPEEYDERAAYLAEGKVETGGETLSPFEMAVYGAGRAPGIQALEPSRLMILGGATLPEERIIWWNFVSTRKERIEQAKADWKEGRFEKVPGEEDFIPLPE